MEYTSETIKEHLDNLIKNKESFVVIALGGLLLKTSQEIEKAIESEGMTCRIYTRNRAIVAGSMAWTGLGLFSLIGIATHNLATFNPDYEIGRAIVDNKIYVTYKKG